MSDTLTQFETLCAGLTDAQFNWSPEPGRWSIAQNLTHLSTVNGLDIEPITGVIADARSRNITGDGPYKYSWMNNYFIATKKFKAPKIYQPPPDAPLAASLAEYRRITSALQGLMLRANGLDLKRVKTIMPALRFMKMPLGARFALVCAHDRRHLWHARNIRNYPAFSA
ncbi:MAG: DinB family protein [Acidobacteriota bacterium]